MTLRRGVLGGGPRPASIAAEIALREIGHPSLLVALDDLAPLAEDRVGCVGDARDTRFAERSAARCVARLTSGRFWLENRSVSESSAAAGVPGRSREQRLRALERANDVRTARAKLKKELASGTIELAQILADPPPYLRTARVRDLLLVLPKIGSVKATRILAHCGIADSKTLAGLTRRQRSELITFFRT